MPLPIEDYALIGNCHAAALVGRDGFIVPWVRRLDGALLATAAPDTLELRPPVAVHGENMKPVHARCRQRRRAPQ